MTNNEEMLQLFEMFSALRHEASEKSVRSKILRHSDYAFEGRTHTNFTSFMFADMADDFTRSLIGELNRFLVNISHADWWVRVTNSCEKEKQPGLLWEFADPFLELSVG